MNQNALINLLKTAKAAGSPRDQVERFLQSYYAPYPWQWHFHAAARAADLDGGPVEIGLGGARGPGKSHAVLSQVVLDDCMRVPNLKVLFLRFTGSAARESFEDLITKTLVGRVRFKYASSKLVITDTHSKVILGGFKDERDVLKYIGIEYDVIIIEELNQITKDKYEKLRGSLRTSKENWRPRVYASFNPGNIGHTFVRETFVLPHREKRETKTRFIPSTYRSNPKLNKEYIEWLEGLEGDLGRAWRDGEWDLFSGQVFSEFRRDKHVLPDIEPSSEFEAYLSMDWGYSEKSAFAAYLHLIKPSSYQGEKFNRIITVREWWGNQKSPEEWADIIYNDLKEMKIEPIRGYTDPAMHNTQTDGSKSIAQSMSERWKSRNDNKQYCQLVRANNNRIARVATVHNWLKDGPDGLPYWVMSQQCQNLANTLPMLVYDEHRVEDVDTDSNDHGYDSVSYFLIMQRFTHIKPGSYKGFGEQKIPKYIDDNGLVTFNPNELFSTMRGANVHTN